MTLLQRIILSCRISFFSVTFFIGVGIGDEPSVPISTSVESWIQGLDDPSYRTRRESFLKLCDRSIPIDSWLESESKSNDKHRSAVAIWLKRLRRSNGSLAERAEILRDYETLKNPDDQAGDKYSVLERYVATDQWEALIDLIALLDPPYRTELLGDDSKLQTIIDRAWKSENEWAVPRLLDLVLKPTERVQANRLWRSLGMPEEWKVSQNSALPSVKVIELEADAKIDEAILLAEKSSLRNLVEPILIRSNRWERWLKMDQRRTPITRLGSFEHQKAGMLILLGRLDEAESLLDQILAGTDRDELSNGTAILALGLGRSDEFEKFLEQQKDEASFNLMRMLGHVHEAFNQVGLNDLSVDAVRTWLENKSNIAKWLSEQSVPSQQKVKAPALADIADLFFQVGLNAQGELIDTKIIEWVMKRESEEGSDAWLPLFGQWLITNERTKVIHHWKSLLIRNSGRRMKAATATTSPFETIYSDFPQSASWIYDYLVSVMNKPGTDAVSDLDRQRKSIERAIEQMEDLHFGRMPKDWIGQRPLVDLRNAIYAKSLEIGNTDIQMVEISKLLDSLGETQLAIETLDLCSADSTVNQTRAELLIRLGQLEAASTILTEEFQNASSDLGLLVDCTETLENIGRFNEMDRYRLQALSSVLEDPAASTLRSNLELPTRKIVQLVMEQRFHRDKLDIGSGFDAARCLSRQYGDAAKKDLSMAKQAANASRIESVLWMKYLWEDQKRDIRPMLSLFGDAFQSLILEAISEGNRELADKLYRIAFRCKPQDIDMPIVVVPIAERVFGKQFADEWFDVFYQPMLKHLEEFPDDTLIGNNTAWLAALCNRNLEKAQYLAQKVTVSNPDPTYLDTLAEVEYRLGHVEKAIEISELCLRLKPKDKQHRDQLKRFRFGKP